MALRDRTIYTRRMGGLPGGDSAPNGSAGGNTAVATASVPAITISGPAERPVVIDKPRSTMSREATELKFKIHDRLVRELDPARLTTDLTPEEARRAVEDAVEELIGQEGAVLSRADSLAVMREVAD